MLEEVKASGRPIVVSFSGGKDSTAMAIWLVNNKVHETNKIYWAFADTGWEHPSVYEYVEHINKTLFNGELNRVVSKAHPNGMPDLIRNQGRFPSRKARMCTRELKIFPLRDFVREIAEKHAPERPINCVGIRAAESEARSALLEWEPGTKLETAKKRIDLCDTWRPLISAVVADIIKIHNDAGIKPCELYLRDKNFSTRVGCYPCIYEHKKSIRAVAETWPERIDQIRELEKEVEGMAKKRYAEKGETFESLGLAPPTFFMSKDFHRDGSLFMDIDKVVAWSKTEKGGRQFGFNILGEAFAPSEEEKGCEMWGLCELTEAVNDEGS